MMMIAYDDDDTTAQVPVSWQAIHGAALVSLACTDVEKPYSIFLACLLERSTVIQKLRKHDAA